jgi:hypothetical protein
MLVTLSRLPASTTFIMGTISSWALFRNTSSCYPTHLDQDQTKSMAILATPR